MRRQFLKHVTTYGLGYVLTRMTSLFLLPVYTRYLTPADYGCIAILDVTVTILGVVLGSGIQLAVNRIHFSTVDPRNRPEVWWTGLSVVASTATIVIVPAIIFRNTLAGWTLGFDELEGGLLFALALPTLWVNSLGALLDAYLQVQKWSGLFVIFSVGRFILNAGLNVLLLAVFEMGAVGVLFGNLMTALLVTSAVFAIFAWHSGSYRVSSKTARALLAFGMPLVLTGLLQVALSQSDRFFLRAYLSLGDVGIYSLAWALGQGVNTCIFLPFAMTWGPVKFEIASREDSRQIYTNVFQTFITLLILLLLAFSLCAYPILYVGVGANYLEAAELIPLICLAYVFFSATDFFTFPAALHSRTGTMIPASVSALIVNLVGNSLLVPAYGMMGAALTLILTFATRATVGYWIGLRIERIGYRLAPFFVLLAVAITTYASIRFLRTTSVPGWLIGLGAGVLWFSLAFFTLGSTIGRLLSGHAEIDMLTTSGPFMRHQRSEATKKIP
jgi:O-antigen/teichoic acid export membrane protein